MKQIITAVIGFFIVAVIWLLYPPNPKAVQATSEVGRINSQGYILIGGITPETAVCYISPGDRWLVVRDISRLQECQEGIKIMGQEWAKSHPSADLLPGEVAK